MEDLQTDEPNDGRQLTLRERQVEAELRRLDPHLAGLFRQGLDLVDRVEDPGCIYLLSHAARELSAALIRMLSGQGEPLKDEGADRVPRDEDHRSTIAQALGLPVLHPSVSTWMRTHQSLQQTAHYRTTPPSVERVQRTVHAFRVLTDILFGRIGLYFDALQELDLLLAVAEPDAGHIERFRALALRPQLRRAFFLQLRHVGWLEPLRSTGLFREPPDLGVDRETGGPTALPWPEGQYLVAIAPEAPDAVVRALLEVPDRIRNPIVWHAVAEAALRLPESQAARLAEKLGLALTNAGHPTVSRSVFAVARRLAQAKHREALHILRGLLTVASVADTHPLLQTATGFRGTLPNLRDVTAELEEVLALIEEVSHLRPRAVVALLCNTLDCMLRIESGDPADHEPPPQDDSEYWLGQIQEHRDRYEKPLIAAAVLRAARVAEGHPAAGAEWVLQRLSRYPWRAFRQLKLKLLAESRVFDQAALDEAIDDPSLLSEQPVSPEYRHLIREHFQNASPETRQAVIDRILRGADDVLLQNVARTAEDVGKSVEDATRDFQEQWWRHRLRLFGNSPPLELRKLAQELGTIDETLTKEERDLDEHGFSIQSGVMGGPRSPLGRDTIRRLSVDELIEFLRTYQFEAGWNAPTPAGLAAALAEYIEEDASGAVALIQRIGVAEVNPTYVRGVLAGILGAAKENKEVPWSEAFTLVIWVASQPPDVDLEGSRGGYFDRVDPGLLWARGIAADLLIESAKGGRMPPEHRGDLWAAVDALIRSDATWAATAAPVSSMEEVLNLELNHVGGKATTALLEVALYDYRAWKAFRTGEEWPARDRLRRLLEAVLGQSGEAAVAARSVLGRYLIHIFLIDRPWFDNNRDRLFDGAIEDPFRNPTFASYVINTRPHEDIFMTLRPLYEVAVQESSVDSNCWTGGKESYRPGRHLLDRLVSAYEAAWLSLDEDADLLDGALTNARREDTRQVWWLRYRSWTDAGDQIDTNVVNRVVALWKWRLTRLEGEEDTERRRGEGEGFGWLALAEAISDERVVPLALRTIRLSGGQLPIAGAFWGRLGRLSEIDVRSATEMAAAIIHRGLVDEFPHFNYAEIAPILRASLRSSDVEPVDMAERVIHALGEHGFEEFGQLLLEREK